MKNPDAPKKDGESWYYLTLKNGRTMNLVSCAEELHEEFTGTGSGNHQVHELHQMREFLAYRARFWKEPSSEYEKALLQLCRAAIQESSICVGRKE